jgi:CRP-like cAMP-binding protein
VSLSEELVTIERVAVLHRVALFANVPGHALVSVARVLEEVRVGEGAVIIQRGAVEDWMFVVVEGRLRVHVDAKTIGEKGPGDVVGELAVLAPAPRSASVTSVEPTLLLRLRRPAFEELLDDQAELSRSVIATLARLLQAMADDDARMSGA